MRLCRALDGDQRLQRRPPQRRAAGGSPHEPLQYRHRLASREQRARAYIVTAYIVMAYMVKAYMVMAYIVMAYGLYSYGLYRCGSNVGAPSKQVSAMAVVSSSMAPLNGLPPVKQQCSAITT